MVGVKVIGNDSEFQAELSGAGSRLAVVKFTMSGCRPCVRIAPAFNMLSNKYPQVVFLEVDVHVCQYQGADASGLEEKIKQHVENDPGSNEDSDIPKGYLLITIAFNQPVKLFSMKLLAPELAQAPKSVKIFINLPRSMGFDDAERSEATQMLDLSEEDYKDDVIYQVEPRRRRDDKSELLDVYRDSCPGDEHERLQTGELWVRREKVTEEEKTTRHIAAISPRASLSANMTGQNHHRHTHRHCRAPDPSLSSPSDEREREREREDTALSQ
ncbi:Thioredoxin-like protein 1 [Labeo rohita]|uniref:Thioredoxin-like protein 1 n=1 Tax=Labeo rohita TaxID=84645 RepID=A0ABQ8LLY6_LABRO|nr:Thioredoxin-like protein 1 [Labeo rohita]